MNELISIIVPVYNVKKYLTKCIDSIINQTYQKIEIILVDDGSSDESGKICDEYSKKDNRIIVKHKENGGLSDARNYGLEFSKGEYIAFVDSDDYLESDYIEVLYNAIKENNVLISQCAINIIGENESLREVKGNFVSIKKNSNQVLEELSYGYWENIVVWNKLYRRELFDNIKFPKGKIHEDEFTTYKIVYKVKEVYIVGKSLYNYRKNENSITGKNFNEKRLELLIAIEERIKFFKVRNEEKLYALSIILYLNILKDYYRKVIKNLENYEKIQIDIKYKYRKYYKYILKSKYIGSIRKIKLFLFYINPDLFWKIKYMSKGMK